MPFHTLLFAEKKGCNSVETVKIDRYFAVDGGKISVWKQVNR